MKIVFMGTPAAAVSSLERILLDGHDVVAVYTQPDRPSGRGNKIVFSPVKEFALQNNLHVLQPLKIKIPEALKEFESHAAEVAVVVAYGRILPETFLRAFPKGAINVHFSLLPKYRGAAPVNWAIANGETRTGITTMRMDAGLDTGDILLQSETEIGKEETAVELMERLSITGAGLLSETLANFNELTAQPQDNAEATFAPIMKREDGLIDWNMTAVEISDRVRGFQPFPTSFSYYKKHKLTIWKAKRYNGIDFRPTIAGEVFDAKGDSLLVSCGGDTILEIIELQLEGKRRLPVREFLNGVGIQKGERLGQI